MKYCHKLLYTGVTINHFKHIMCVCVSFLLAYQPKLCAQQQDTDTLYLHNEEVSKMPILDSLDISTPSTVFVQDSVYVDSMIQSVPFIQNSAAIVGESDGIGNGAWMPDPQKAMWLAIAIPGGGQIYNRKYWKLPIIYGGFLGCFYALNWNNTMYRDYSQAYIDIMDSDDNTQSYMNFIPANYDVKSNLTRLQELFKRKKNFYRRYRDMSLFCMIGVYLISIVDAYVDAEMSSFDISRDLTLKVKPAIINDYARTMRTQSLGGSSYGVNCSLSF